MVDTWNPAVLNETTQDIDSWNPAELNQVTTKVDSWNPAILNKNLESSVPVVFSATITASFPEGATCTATDGTTTLTADDNPMDFSIPNSGTWSVACVANGVTFSEDVVITTNGQTETINLTPVGETVTPTDSVPILIACAGIGDSTYTTISEVIADSELLTEITTNDNTIAYLVRSTTFAASITTDEDAMTAIGASNECSDALLGNSTWLNAICNSTYFESVLNVKVPKMTSNTKPSGECIVYNAYSDYTNKQWQSFDGNINTLFALKKQEGSYVGYKFTNAKKIYCATLNTTSLGNQTVEINSSSDGNNWTSITSFTVSSSNSKVVFTSSDTHQYFNMKLASIGSVGTAGVFFNDIQFYGRVDV